MIPKLAYIHLVLSISLLLTILGGKAIFAGMIDESGLKPWENCALCHSLNGISRMAKFPILAGQFPRYIEKQLHDFRSGRRENDGGQMKAMAGLIKADDIPVVAQYFYLQPQPLPSNAEKTKALKIARKIAETGDVSRGIPACGSCHGQNAGGESNAPFLEAQHADYLSKQIRDFKDGLRKNDSAQIKQTIMQKLSEGEIVALADYYASVARKTQSHVSQ